MGGHLVIKLSENHVYKDKQVKLNPVMDLHCSYWRVLIMIIS